jgi:hypothetical protein
MTDRYLTLTVVLENEIREVDAEALIGAIRQLRGVINVKGDVADINSYMAITRARTELTKRLWKALKDEEK